jgi:hypothetical protein
VNIFGLRVFGQSHRDLGGIRDRVIGLIQEVQLHEELRSFVYGLDHAWRECQLDLAGARGEQGPPRDLEQGIAFSETFGLLGRSGAQDDVMDEW